jgi:hypothetical protein
MKLPNPDPEHNCPYAPSEDWRMLARKYIQIFVRTDGVPTSAYMVLHFHAAVAVNINWCPFCGQNFKQ